MAGPGMPRAVAQLHLAHFRQREATPLASRRQARLALAAELVSQRFLLALRVAEDDRAKPRARTRRRRSESVLLPPSPERTDCNSGLAWHAKARRELRPNKHSP